MGQNDNNLLFCCYWMLTCLLSQLFVAKRLKEEVQYSPERECWSCLCHNCGVSGRCHGDLGVAGKAMSYIPTASLLCSTNGGWTVLVLKKGLKLKINFKSDWFEESFLLFPEISRSISRVFCPDLVCCFSSVSWILLHFFSLLGVFGHKIEMSL